MKNILVVDDNEEILEIVSYHLRKKGFSVYPALSAEDALDIIEEREISCAVLDVMLPGMDGFCLCRKIREDRFFPILFLTARVGENDKIEGLMSGADDYMEKPFSAAELTARIDSLIRRSTMYTEKSRKPGILRAKLLYDPVSGAFSVDGAKIDFTDIEYRILLLLFCEEKRTFSTEEIYCRIWGAVFTSSSNNNVVVHIKNIRHKLAEFDQQTEYIHTVWGKGYSFYV